ncbi:Na/Pi symporter [Thalassotalea ponticola]|uniref:Na/Pi cotransporter family protein n=1 Tax=Thalassotalea ponticola TaxID=1523392 RepID=UPI0025B4F1DB|nr:Na/Pi symporter [Thalassotalea ponticola]MDN3651179.1 Na/Pi symporter [Thalassotalea ponticola]
MAINYPMLLTTLGGLGIFLIGMVIMTNALHELAGTALRRVLLRFTKSPTTGAVTGAISTAILQSSSATTVAAVGFVGAGIITFSESLGIIFGANIGTTITGWLVALVGFKLQLTNVLLPLIFIGALLKLFTKGKLAAVGMVMAGFGLIFVGISQLQQGMSGLQSVITPETFPDDSPLGRLKLVLIGIAITLVTQSSSAGVATAITALYAGAINFNQAAALVIGMDVGTTITALMVTIGGSVAVKRTGYSHVVYNILTAIGALILLTPFTYLYELLFPDQLQRNGEIALVAFHTVFNALGVLLILPFTRHFAALMKRLVGREQKSFTQSLETAFLAHPDVALTAAKSAVIPQFVELLRYLHWLLGDRRSQVTGEFGQLEIALDRTHEYVDLIHIDKREKPDWFTLVSLIHLLDHMQRLHERCYDKNVMSLQQSGQHVLYSSVAELVYSIELMLNSIESGDFYQSYRQIRDCDNYLKPSLEQYRQDIVQRIANGEITVPEATQSLDSARALQRLLHNLHRASYYIADINEAITK